MYMKNIEDDNEKLILNLYTERSHLFFIKLHVLTGHHQRLWLLQSYSDTSLNVLGPVVQN